MSALGESDYAKPLALLDGAELNTLFARAVLERRLPGKVLADRAHSPTSYLVVHPYGMSLLLGDPGNEEFNRDLAAYMTDAQSIRRKPEWVQAHPDEWHRAIRESLGPDLLQGPGAPEPGKVRQLTRVNFRFDREEFMESLAAAPEPPHDIVPTTAEFFDNMPGKVIPRYFWRDAGHFLREGAGCTMVVNGEPASTAFSAFVAPGILELGIETAEPHRGMGYAEHVCRALIGHCLDNGLEPVWACREDNVGSYRLALKLGFRLTLRVPYYQLAFRD